MNGNESNMYEIVRPTSRAAFRHGYPDHIMLLLAWGILTNVHNLYASNLLRGMKSKLAKER
jgi:hypothetical protein